MVAEVCSLAALRDEYQQTPARPRKDMTDKIKKKAGEDLTTRMEERSARDRAAEAPQGEMGHCAISSPEADAHRTQHAMTRGLSRRSSRSLKSRLKDKKQATQPAARPGGGPVRAPVDDNLKRRSRSCWISGSSGDLREEVMEHSQSRPPWKPHCEVEYSEGSLTTRKCCEGSLGAPSYNTTPV